MNILGRIMAVLAIFMLVGCATSGGGGGSSSASSSGGGSGKMLTDEDYKRIGVAETYETR